MCLLEVSAGQLNAEDYCFFFGLCFFFLGLLPDLIIDSCGYEAENRLATSIVARRQMNAEGFNFGLAPIHHRPHHECRPALLLWPSPSHESDEIPMCLDTFPSQFFTGCDVAR